MRNLMPAFGVLGVLAFVALHACSSDDEAGDGKKQGGGGGGGNAGDGGDAGAPSGGTSGSGTTGGGTGGTNRGGSGGTDGGAGAGGQAGEATGGVGGDSGSGGEGGTGAVGPGAECTTCMASNADELIANCGTSPPCSAWLECVRGCSDSACLDACDAASPEVAPYQYEIYEALCTPCGTTCAALELCDRGCVDNLNLPLHMTPPATLAETFLYTSPMSPPDPVATYARPFHPEYELWSDGAQKRRWAYIPRCERIGNAGMNYWIFPVGTRMWKEFVVPDTSMGNAGVRVETRLIHRYGPGENDWLFASYQWPLNDPTPTAGEAMLVPQMPQDLGVMNANGTMHDIPSRAQCILCHGTLASRVLGFSALQLSHTTGGVTIRELADNGWLTHPAAAAGIGGALARNGYDPPGNEQQQRALGYLHANCSHCHHPGTVHGENIMTGTPAARMYLMVGFMDTFEATHTYMTMVNQPTTRAGFVGCDRIEPGFANFSEVIMRMNRRGTPLQMPQLGTSEQVHTAAVTQLTAWVNAMPSSGVAPTTCMPPP